jgi:transposase
MGRPKGGKNRKHSIEFKVMVVKKHLEEGYKQAEILEEYNLSNSLFDKWLTRYLEEGETGLKPRKRGNPFAALYTSKHLSEVERLKLELMKKEIEIERLKKGYQVKGVGSKKEYVTLSDKTIK